ncbi:MAG: hypothetical protein EXS09_05515 [Gemmataceae bacterium]|nr:hypothetical protein [Gemmataceae bacterium]
MGLDSFRAVALAAISSSIAAGAPALPERPSTDPTIVELKANGDVVPNGQKAISDPAEIKKTLVNERERQERAAKLNRVPASPSILIRAANDSPYHRLIELMDIAKSAGFVTVTLEPASRGK